MGKVIELKSGMDLEKVQLAEKIANDEDFSTVILNASLDGILTYDLNVRYTLWSPQMEKITGLKSEQVLGKCAFDLFPFLKDAGIPEVCEKTFRGESAQSGVMRYTIAETGLTGYTRQYNFPLYNETGQITGGIAIVREVTAIKDLFDKLTTANRELETRVEELEQQLEAIQPLKSTPLHQLLKRLSKPLHPTRTQNKPRARVNPKVQTSETSSD